MWVEVSQGQRQGYRCVDLPITETRGDGGLGLEERSRDKRRVDSEYILKVEPTGFTGRLDVYCKRKRGAAND